MNGIINEGRGRGLIEEDKLGEVVGDELLKIYYSTI